MNKSQILLAMVAAFRKEFEGGLEITAATWNKIAMEIPSTTAMNTYAWLGKFPQMKKWVGERQVEKMDKQAMSLSNDLFEATVAVARTDIEDDQYGLYRPMMKEMGASAAYLPETLVWSLLPKGKETLCYDGQNFFDAEHPVYAKVDGTGTNTPTANITVGADVDAPAFYVLDTTRVMKPIIFQNRTAPEFEAKFDPSKSDTVFMEDQYLYGARRRGAAGFALWQLAHMAEKTKLTAANLSAIITKMRSIESDGGYKLNVQPSLLVVPPALEEEARKLLNAEIIDGSTNTFKGRLDLHVSVHLS